MTVHLNIELNMPQLTTVCKSCSGNADSKCRMAELKHTLRSVPTAEQAKNADINPDGIRRICPNGYSNTKYTRIL